MLLEDTRDAVTPPWRGPGCVRRDGTPLSGRTRGRAGKSVRIEAPSRVEMVEAVDLLVGQLAAAAGSESDFAQDVQLATHEAVINAIVHGNRLDEARRVVVVLSIDAGSIEIRVRDEGQGFDPSRVPDPRAPENLCRTSGRGLFLMRRLMDEVAIRRRARGGTEVRMLKRRAPKPKARGQE